MSDCRCLYRVGAVHMPPTNVAPGIATPHEAAERERLGDFLSTALMKPMHHSLQQHRLNVEQALNTMTLAERITIEIEMTERGKVMHSYDYDALKVT